MPTPLAEHTGGAGADGVAVPEVGGVAGVAGAPVVVPVGAPVVVPVVVPVAGVPVVVVLEPVPAPEAVPLPVVEVAPGVEPAAHEPLVGVGRGAVEVRLGVVITSAVPDPGPLPATAVEGTVVEIGVVSVRPWAAVEMSGVVTGFALTGAAALVSLTGCLTRCFFADLVASDFFKGKR